MKKYVLLYFILFILIYLIIKSFIFWKRYNINPVQSYKGNFVDKIGWYGFSFGIILYVINIVLFYLDKTKLFFNILYLDFIGYILMSIGLVIIIMGHIKLGKSWRMGLDYNNKTELISDGIYKYSRNPVYLGIIILGISFLILMPNIFSIVLTILGILSLFIIIRSEEKFLENQFGRKYLEYKNKVRIFI